MNIYNSGTSKLRHAVQTCNLILCRTTQYAKIALQVTTKVRVVFEASSETNSVQFIEQVPTTVRSIINIHNSPYCPNIVIVYVNYSRIFIYVVSVLEITIEKVRYIGLFKI